MTTPMARQPLARGQVSTLSPSYVTYMEPGFEVFTCLLEKSGLPRVKIQHGLNATDACAPSFNARRLTKTALTV